MDFLKSLIHDGAKLLADVPILGDVAKPVRDCTETAAERKKRQSWAWLHKLALPIGGGIAAISTIYSIAEFGPTPIGLLGGPIAGLIVYAAIDIVACMMEGRKGLVCVFGNLTSFTGDAVGSVTGVNPHLPLKMAAKAETSVLNALGCKASGGK